MSKVPSLSYGRIVRALQREGWVVVRKKGSHVRLQKHISDEVLKLTIPTHRTVKRSTLAHIIKQARLTVEDFLNLIYTRVKLPAYKAGHLKSR